MALPRTSMSARATASRYRPLLVVLALAIAAGGCGTRHALGGGLFRGATPERSDGYHWGPGWGPGVSGRFWTPTEGAGGLVTVDLQPFRVVNPEGTRHFRALYVQPQFQVRPAPVFLRAGLGLMHYTFGGSRDPRGGFLGVSLGVGLGVDVRDWSLEAFWRGGAPLEGEIESDLFGVQLSVYTR